MTLFCSGDAVLRIFFHAFKRYGDQIEIRVIEFSAVNCKLSGCHKDVHVDIKTQKNNVFSEGFMRKGNFITKTSARFGDIDELIDLSKKLKSKEE